MRKCLHLLLYKTFLELMNIFDFRIEQAEAFILSNQLQLTKKFYMFTESCISFVVSTLLRSEQTTDLEFENLGNYFSTRPKN